MQEQFQAGMHVRYGGTGICLIERIGEVPYPGDQPVRICYVLRPVRNMSMEISVPLDNALLCARMQPLRTKEEIDRMLDNAIELDALPWQEDRKLRAAEFRKILAGGDAQSLLQMIRCILKRRAELLAVGKHLAAADDNARKDAARLLDEEFGFSLGMSPREAGQYICDRLQVEKVQ
ncbi:MAG: CarD family transcriptional regulator [Oscillospiraceae bacterium]|nr:CarD family transcriptional regulator [Oscillospiraceae bacterium]